MQYIYFWPKINWSLSFFLLVFLLDLLHINNLYFGVFTSKIDGSIKCKQTHEFGFEDYYDKVNNYGQ